MCVNDFFLVTESEQSGQGQLSGGVEVVKHGENNDIDSERQNLFILS